MSDSPPLIARGTLEKTPLAEFLVRALDERLEGTLILQLPGGNKHAVLFLQGAPAKGRLHESPIFLSDVITDLELVVRSVAVSTRKRAQAEGRPHGEVLVEEGHLDASSLYIALREQLKRQMLLLCDLPGDTVFGLYKANYLAGWGPAEQWRVKPLPLIWRAVVDHLPKERRDAVLERLGGHVLRMRFEAPVSRYAMTKNELSMINMLRAKPQTLTELEDCGIGSPEAVRKAVCGLVVSRQLEGTARQGNPVGYSEPPESPNSVPPPSMRAARRSITAPRAPRVPSGMEPPSSSTDGPTSLRAPQSAGAASSMGTISMGTSSTGTSSTGTSSTGKSVPVESARDAAFREAVEAWEQSPPGNLYDILGVANDAEASVIQRAFFQLARHWHPDKLSPELADLRPLVTRAFARMGEANQILTDSKQRAEYDARLRDVPEDEQEQVAAILEASAAFQRADILLKKRDYKQAAVEAKLALDGDPGQADYIGLLAWTLSLSGQGKTAEHIAALSNAIEKEPENIRCLWYRGQLQKKAGNELVAMRDFKKILKLKPTHMDAKRELRVYEMRTKTGKGQGGLFGTGLFKKD